MSCLCQSVYDAWWVSIQWLWEELGLGLYLAIANDGPIEARQYISNDGACSSIIHIMLRGMVVVVRGVSVR